jgi:hypothetical protein
MQTSDTLTEQLKAAELAVEDAIRVHGEAALSVAEGADQSLLTRASKVLDAAKQRVSDLSAALPAARIREERQRADAAAERERATIAAVNVVLQKLKDLGTDWDALVEQLVATSKALDDTARDLHAYDVPPVVYFRMQQARNRVMSILAARLKSFAGETPGVLLLGPGEEARLVSFLPVPQPVE